MSGRQPPVTATLFDAFFLLAQFDRQLLAIVDLSLQVSLSALLLGTLLGLPLGAWLYPEDQISDAPLRFLAAEITREKMFERLHDELPYRSTVETESWQQKPDGSVRIEQTIYVEREGQRKIVLGEGGQTIKAIGQKARVEIAEAAEAKVHLFLFVKVRENWSDDPERYREMGLEFPKGKG